MALTIAWEPEALNRRSLEHAVRTALAATISYLVANFFHLSQPYWATVTAIVVMQSTLGASLSISVVRLVGTSIGAAAGGLLATWFGPNLYVYTAGVFLLGVLSAALHLDRAAFRFAGITLTIVMLVVLPVSPWHVALHRFIEVSLGIVIGLLMTVVWPERPSLPASAPPATSRS